MPDNNQNIGAETAAPEAIPQGAELRPIQAPGTGEAVPQGAELRPIGKAVEQGPITPSDVGTHISAIGQNIQKGFESTAAGLGEIGSKIPGVSYLAEKAGDILGLKPLAPGVDPYKAISEEASHGVGSSFDQIVGYGGEALMEFLAGDAAFKGLSYGAKLTEAGKIASLLEGYPKLMNALKMGAAASKAAIKMSPEEAALVQKYPVLSRLVASGMEAARAGAVQGTIAATGKVGTAEERAKRGAEEGATMAAVTAPLGAVGAVARGVAAKGAKAAGTVERLTGMAEGALGKEEVVDKAQQMIAKAKEGMHTNFESAISDPEKGIIPRLEGAELPVKGSPVSEQAKKLLEQPSPETHPVVAQAKKAAGERLDGDVKKLIENTAKGELPAEGKGVAGAGAGGERKVILTDVETGEPTLEAAKPMRNFTAQDLVDLRQTVRKLASTYDRGDINARALNSMLGPIDDTIEQLAKQTGDKSVVSDYQSARAEYRRMNDLIRNNPVLKSLEKGNRDDAARNFFAGGRGRENAEAVRSFIGDDAMKDFSHDIFGTMLQDAKDANGMVNSRKLVEKWSKIPSDVKEKVFDLSDTGRYIAELTKDAKSAAQIQTLTRAGIMGTIGAVTGGGIGAHFGGAGIGSLLGIFMGEGGGSIAAGRNLLDYVANHPATWKMFRAAGKVAESKGLASVTSAATKAAGVGAAKAVGAPVRRVYQGAAGPMGGNQ
jgi:hypothetical protein